METYREFLNRIDSFEKPELFLGDKNFIANPSVAKKVDKDNKFKNFYGDTVVFELDGAIKKKLSEQVDTLYKTCPQCFCERLVDDTFHMTLHDLGNSAVLSDVAEELFANELKVIEKRPELKKFKNAKLKMKSKYIFNMVDTSLVLGLYPVDNDNYLRLMDLYTVFDDVKKLNYPLTPHITLAYYNVFGFDKLHAHMLEDVITRLNNDVSEWDIELSVKNLFYQKFTSMNNYIDIIDLFG